MSWIGGKKSLRDLILLRFPPYYERYIEVFGGGGWVLFAKPPGYGVTKAPVEPSRASAVAFSNGGECRQAPGNDFEVYNDFNGVLVNLFRQVRDNPAELLKALKYAINSREDFDVIRTSFSRDAPMSDVQKAANFYQLIRYSYASGLKSYGSQPHDIWTNFPLIEQAHRRLRKVVIENKDCVKLIKQYDRPVSFFYCDPPYYETESYYENIGDNGFGEKDHIRLRDALLSIQGKFLLSYNDCPFVRELYSHEGIYMQATTRINNIKQRYDGGCQYEELLIANYDLHEREREAPSQMNFFENMQEETE